MTPRHNIRGVIPPDAALPLATQPPIAEFVKRWAPGDGGTAVTLRLQAEVRWQARASQDDLEPEARADFDAAVMSGMRQMAVALGVTFDATADAPSVAPQDRARPAAIPSLASPSPSTSLSLSNRGVAP